VDAYKEKYVKKEKYTKEREMKKNASIPSLGESFHRMEGHQLLAQSGRTVVVGSPTTVVRDQTRWWDKNATIAGEGQTEVQARLSLPKSFTGVYRRRFNPEVFHHNSESGDLCTHPKKALRLLKEVSTKALGESKNARACDFRSEVEWRLTLRDSHGHL
jgi:hypothetical protein